VIESLLSLFVPVKRRSVANAGQVLACRSIRPVAYSGRAPHIHFRVKRAGHEVLTTQLYVAGDPSNEHDGLYRREPNRTALTAAFAPANGIEHGALAATWIFA
jgi:protocatechuate 3,4-dioxygenase, beta subunit